MEKAWSAEDIAKYHEFTKNYISTYDKEIDCADLAFVALIEFAGQEHLPLRFKYYYHGDWKWITFSPSTDDVDAFKQQAQSMLGALNIIDNTVKIDLESAKPGDLIMSKWSNTQGHTRIIYSTLYEGFDDYKVVWYQGNLPPVVPEKREDYFSDIEGVYEDLPRRWNFEQFGE